MHGVKAKSDMGELKTFNTWIFINVKIVFVTVWILEEVFIVI